MIPTGSRDPFALRRAAQGVVKIVVEGRMEIDLLPYLDGEHADPTPPVGAGHARPAPEQAHALRDFLQDRTRYYFKDIRGFKYDEVNAAMAAGWSNLVDLEARLERIQNLRASADFEPLAASFKRIRNILDQAKFVGQALSPASLAGESGCPTSIDESLLEPGPEKDLYDECRRTAGQPIENAIARLRPKVDLFFDKVLVNAPDARVRQNRLTLLHTLLEEFSSIADFSEIVTNS